MYFPKPGALISEALSIVQNLYGALFLMLAIVCDPLGCFHTESISVLKESLQKLLSMLSSFNISDRKLMHMWSTYNLREETRLSSK